MSVPSGQTIRSQHVEAFDLPGSDCIAQALQGGAHQRGAALPLVHVAVVGRDPAPIGRDALAQSGDLAVDRMLARLGLAGYARVEGHQTFSHAQSSSSEPARAL